jgi:hypothetical protein
VLIYNQQILHVIIAFSLPETATWAVSCKLGLDASDLNGGG